jgi:hypothetical protein
MDSRPGRAAAGRLPDQIYWRRRGVVLVALVVVIAIGLIFVLTIPRMARFLDLFGRRRPVRQAPPPT